MKHIKTTITKLLHICAEHKALLLVGLIFFSLSMYVSVDGLSDDSYFNDVHNKYGFFEYLKLRYETWSPRILAEGLLYYLAYISIFVWRIINTLSWVLLVVSLARTMHTDYKKHLYAAFILLFCINSSILASGGFQVTASVNYILPVSILLYCISPIIRAYNTQSSLHQVKLGYIRLAAIPLLGLLNEQVGIVAIVVLALYIVATYLRSYKVYFAALLSLLCAAGILFVLWAASGNDIRFASSVEAWFPEYTSIGYAGRIRVFAIWLYASMFVKLGALIIFAGVMAATIKLKNKDSPRTATLRYVGSLYLLVPAAVALLNIGYTEKLHTGLEKLLYSFDFGFVYQTIGGGLPIYGGGFMLKLTSYSFWTLYVVLLCMVIRRNVSAAAAITLLLSIVVSLGLFMFSPTIFASGSRILLLPAVLMVALLLPVFTKTSAPLKLFAVAFACVNTATLLLYWVATGYTSIY